MRSSAEVRARLEELKKINEEHGGLTADELAEAMVLEEKLKKLGSGGGRSEATEE